MHIYIFTHLCICMMIYTSCLNNLCRIYSYKSNDTTLCIFIVDILVRRKLCEDLSGRQTVAAEPCKDAKPITTKLRQ